jgi:serine/threonine protein kinase
MRITEPHVIPPDVRLHPVDQLPDDTRSRLETEIGDFAIARPQSRSSAMIIDARAAALLDRFRSARTIGEAVLQQSRADQLDPEQALADALPLLRRVIDAGFLVPMSSSRAAPIEPTLRMGTRIGAFTLGECVQALADVELYQAHGAANVRVALKIARAEHERTHAELEREADVLRRVGGAIAPALLETGLFEDRGYLAMEWCAGVEATAAADEMRAAPNGGRERVLRLCVAIARVYASLHERGVVHGDVHSRNVLVGTDDAVRLIDLGLSRCLDSSAGAPQRRGGVGWFFEPEYAAARLASRSAPPATPEGEQYAVATLLYLLCAGVHYVDFALDRNRAYRQIVESPPLSFGSRGAEPWPDVERALARALAKAPADRFASMTELADALEAAAIPSPVTYGRPAVDAASQRLVRQWRERFSFGGALFERGMTAEPTCSVNNGAAGVAYALLRMAFLRDDAELLAAADVWAARALDDSSGAGAFYSVGAMQTRDEDRSIALYHTITGVQCVRALVALGLGDNANAQQATDAFVAATSFPSRERDLTLGRSGLLLGCSLIHDAMPPSPYLDRTALLAGGQAIFDALHRELDRFAPIGEEPRFKSFGVAHGWSGVLYAMMRWCRSTHTPLSAMFAERLDQLAMCGEPWGRGMRWRWMNGERWSEVAHSMPGWCNGSAGLVHLWTLAHTMVGGDRWLDIAQQTGWNTWEASVPDASFDLCCGTGGRAYALLELYRSTGDRAWLDRGVALAERAATYAESFEEGEGNALYKGVTGIALLAAELERPLDACMPLFADEGWPEST